VAILSCGSNHLRLVEIINWPGLIANATDKPITRWPRSLCLCKAPMAWRPERCNYSSPGHPDGHSERHLILSLRARTRFSGWKLIKNTRSKLRGIGVARQQTRSTQQAAGNISRKGLKINGNNGIITTSRAENAVDCPYTSRPERYDQTVWRPGSVKRCVDAGKAIRHVRHRTSRRHRGAVGRGHGARGDHGQGVTLASEPEFLFRAPTRAASRIPCRHLEAVDTGSKGE